MPTMANITVKDAANADVVYTAASPSAGDRSPAVWRRNDVSTVLGHRHRLAMVTRDNVKQNGRVFEASYRGVITAVINGVETHMATIPITMQGTIPTNVDSTDVNDCVIQATNLFASALLRTALAEGYAPT